MKTRKVLAALMAIAMVVMSFGAITAHAEGGWDITTERNGDVLTFSFAVSEDLGIAGGLVYFETDPDYGEFHTYDHDAFTFNWEDVYCLPGLLSDLSQYVLQLGTPNGNEYACHTGDVIFSVSYQINSSFKKGETYSFTFYVPEMTDFDGENYPGYAGWMDEGNTDGYITVTYMEPADEPTPTTHTVKFVSNGVVLSEVEVNDGETVDEPAEPTREGYTFKGWKLNGADYDFTTPVTSDLTLTAAWEANEGTMNTDVDLSNISITKNVQAGDNEYDEITFTFAVEAVSAESPIEGVTAPELSNLEVTMSGDDTTATVNFPADVTFPAGGVYTYHITEVTPDPVPEGWTYNANNNEYYLVLEVEPNGNALILDKVVIHSGTADGAKANEMSFTNVYDYEPVTDLTITKTVEGEPDNPVDGTVKFDFEITFTESFTGIINGEEVEFIADVPYEFQLGDGESLFIENIPAGISYTIVEKGNEYYKGSAIAYENDVKAAEVRAENFGEDVRISADAVIAESGKNKVDFTNTYGIPPITGITMHGEMIAIIALALVALVGGFVLSRKLRRSED